MAFRFPHPLENVVDAIKDAADPDTKEDGGLAIQLMNENNHAVEDHLDNPAVYYDLVGTLSGTSDSFTVSGQIPKSGLWLVGVGLSFNTSSADTFPSKVAYIRMDVSAFSAGIIYVENVVPMIPNPSASGSLLGGSWYASTIFTAPSFGDIQVEVNTTSSLNTANWDSSSIGVDLWAVRLGPGVGGLR